MDIETNKLYKEFENIVRKIFELNNFRTENAPQGSYDFLAVFRDTFCYVEVKLYRRKLPKLDLLKIASANLLAQKDNENAQLILVVSSYVTPSLQEEIFREFGVTIWDIKTIIALAFDFSEIFYDLENILVIALKESIDEFSIVDSNFKSQIIPLLENTRTDVESRPIITKGKELCEELNKIEFGKKNSTKNAIAYENKCIEILKHLFDNKVDLALWEKQLASDDGINRYDLLCRIISHNDTFWTELAYDFHTRYVVFEFKNYTDSIKQGQILTTEKYLFLTALRSVSFIIARRGADDNAIKVAKGALKESGKLIVILDNSDICEMLRLKDNGDEPSAVLRERIDDMLIHINR